MTAKRPLESDEPFPARAAIPPRAHAIVAAARAHPRHLVLAALVVGLLGGDAPSELLVAVAGAVAALLCPTRRVAALVVMALLAGTGWSQARTDALEQSALAVSVGAEMAGRLVALEPPRERRGGYVAFRARWLDGHARGEVGVVRLAPSDAAGFRSATETGATSTAAIVPGSVLAVSARIEPLAAWESYQRLRGAQAAIVVRTWWPAGRRDGFAGALDAARDRSRAGLATGIRSPQSALLRGMVLGEDDAVSAEVRADFRRSGLAHLLAVSGQNVMLLATLAMALATVLGASLRSRLAFALALVVIYVPLAGGGPSIQRAGVMGAAGLVAALAGRLSDRWYALLLAAAITLGVNPLAAQDPGWQLSFAAVIGLLCAAGPATRALAGWGVPRSAAEVVAITSVATVATAPLLILHFGQFSLVSLPANVLAAPAVAPVMWLGMLAAGVAQLDPVLAQPLTWCNAHLVAYIEWVAHAFAALPHASVTVSIEEATAPAVVVTLGTVGLVALWRRRLRAITARDSGRDAVIRPLAARILICAAVVALIGGWTVVRRGEAPAVADGELIVSFLDVGQGDATLLQTRRAAILFDTGPPDGPVLERLEEAGVRRLDALVLTHAQADHEGAAQAVIARLRPRLVLNGGHGWPTAVQGYLQRHRMPDGGRVVAAHAGQKISVDGIGLELLWPPRDERADVSRDPNEVALVAHVRHGDFDLLLPADAESGVLRRLELAPVEALKVSHHGSEDAGLPDVLARLRPAVAAIEVGRGNSYGHPAPGTLAALKVVPQVARTDVDGTVRLRVRGRTMELQR